MPTLSPVSLEDLALATYCALDDALQSAGIAAVHGKLIARRGCAPDVDDREILCLAVLQELLDFESDNAFYQWFQANPVMRQLFPRRLSRQNFADRRALLTPLLQKLCGAFCALNGEADPPFSSSIPIRSKSAAGSGRVVRPGLAAWQKTDTAKRCGMVFTGCGKHLIFTPSGRLAFMVQISGHRHDVQGLYALMHTSFRGHLLGDNAYWPKEKMEPQLFRKGILMTADTRRGFGFQYPPEVRAIQRYERSRVERFISLFDRQFNAARTFNRSQHHYLARRWTKALAHNASRHINVLQNGSIDSLARIHLAA